MKETVTKVKATIEIPFLPPRELSPNWRGHWSKRHQASQMMKLAAWALAKQGGLPSFRRATIHITYVVRPARRDPDNWLIMAKPAVDGLVEAGVLPDDSSNFVKYAPLVFRIRPGEAPRTIIEIHGIEAK